MRIYKSSAFFLIIFFIVSCEPWDLEPRKDHYYAMFDITIGSPPDEVPWSIIQTNDNGYVIVGKSINNLKSNIFICKISESGRELWGFPISNINDQEGIGIKEVNNGFILFGNTKLNDTTEQIVMVKINEVGAVNWNTEFGLPGFENKVYSIVAKNNYDYVVVGYSSTFNLLDYGIETIIYNINDQGEEKAHYCYNFLSGIDDFGAYAVIDKSNFITILSYSSIGGDLYDLYLLKLRSDNYQLLWNKKIVESCIKIDNSFKQLEDGKYIISCALNDNSVYLVNADNSGNKIWERTYNETSATSSISIVQTNDGFAFLTNTMQLVKTDNKGVFLWKKEYPTGMKQPINGNNCLLKSKDNGFIIAGQKYNSINNSNDIYVIKTDPEGNILK